MVLVIVSALSSEALS